MSECSLLKPMPQNPLTQRSMAFHVLALCLWHLNQMPTAVQIHHVIPNALILFTCMPIYMYTLFFYDINGK